MKNTRAFYHFQLRINSLIKHFIPKNIQVDSYLVTRNTDPLKTYSKAEEDLLRSFRLLVHAEIEHFMESRVKDIVNKAHAIWQSDKKPTLVITSLLAYMEYAKEKTLTDRINAAVKNYNNIVDGNHGIKKRNVVSLLCPIGVEPNSLNVVWLNTLDSFGGKRGHVAHSSFRVQTPIDPVNEISEIKQIIDEIKNLDKELRKIK